MRRNSHEEPGGFGDVGGMLIFTIALVHCIARTLHAFTRVPGSCGKRYFGAGAWVGWVVYGVFVEGSRPTAGHGPLLALWIAMPALFVVHRAVSTARYSRGTTCHTLYVGDSIFQRLLPFAGADFCRGPLETLTSCLTGLLLLGPMPVLGWWLVVAGTANLLSLALLDARDSRRVEQMEDARIESQALAERVRERWRDD